MNHSVTLVRTFFVLIAALLISSYVFNNSDQGFSSYKILLSVGLTALLFISLFSAERFLFHYNLRAFNISAIGIFFGYLLGQAVLLVLTKALEISAVPLDTPIFQLGGVLILLFFVYLGTVLTARSAEEISLSIPFVRFKALIEKKKDILIDGSILNDSRILDLAASGLLDHHVILPAFVYADLQMQADSQDEMVKTKARRCLDIVKKLESMSSLGLRFTETDFPETKEPMVKLVRLARLMDANILTADISRIQQSEIEGVKIINIHTLANLLKPLTQAGEFISIKIQRYGKEARQGVGYLEDGTMVVVNGAADFIGDTIKARVLSVKHTSSGRMIFCNATDGVGAPLDLPVTQEELQVSSKKYFAQ